MGLPLTPDTFFLCETNNKNTLLVSKVENINVNEIKISGLWRWDEQPRSKWTWSNGRRLTACAANLRRSANWLWHNTKTNIKLNKCSYATMPLWTTIKHRKNCESCPTQFTWKIKFKCQICLSVLHLLSDYWQKCVNATSNILMPKHIKWSQIQRLWKIFIQGAIWLQVIKQRL